MNVVCKKLGGAACAVAFAVLASTPSAAAQSNSGVTVAAEELDRRSKQAQSEQGDGDGKGMTDSAVRVLLTYAFSIIPEEANTVDGVRKKNDKSDPNKYFIPFDDARRIIRAATRSAYAEVCKVPELGAANFRTMMQAEIDKKTWSEEQLQMISALHVFSVSYFTGNIKITAKEEDPDKPKDPDAPPGAGDPAMESSEDGKTRVITSEAPKCSPGQKEKVTNAIKAYIQQAAKENK